MASALVVALVALLAHEGAAKSRKTRAYAYTMKDVRAWAGRIYPLGEDVPQAVAVAVRADGRGVAGFAHGYEHPTQALAEALAQCEKERPQVAGAGACRPFSIGSNVVFDFESDRERSDAPAAQERSDAPAVRASDACLEKTSVHFYRLDMWLRVFRAGNLSYQESYETEFEVRLAPDGSLQAADLTQSESAEFDPWAQRILETAGPFGPLFGELACLRGAAFRFRFSDPRTPATGAL